MTTKMIGVQHNMMDGVTNDDVMAIYMGPSLYSNKVLVTTNGQVCRLTFMEMGPDKPHFRTSVCMTIDDVRALRATIDSLLP